MEEINRFKREGLSILAISNLAGYDRETIRKYLLAAGGKTGLWTEAGASQQVIAV